MFYLIHNHHFCFQSCILYMSLIKTLNNCIYLVDADNNMKNWLFSRNIFVVLAYRIILIMLLFSLCRIGFFLFNFKMFPGVSPGQFLTMLKGGLSFDISAIVYINMLFILLSIIPFDIRYNDVYKSVLKYIYLHYKRDRNSHERDGFRLLQVC